MEDAERAFNAVAGGGQLSPDAVYFLATLADERNRGETARPMLEAALKNEGQFAYRTKAQKLLDRLSKKPAPRGAKGKAAAKAAPSKGAAGKAAAKAEPKAEEPAEDEDKDK